MLLLLGWLGPVLTLEYEGMKRLESFLMEYISLPARRSCPEDWDKVGDVDESMDTTD